MVMRCPEYLRLRQRYEASNRRWGRCYYVLGTLADASTTMNVYGKAARSGKPTQRSRRWS
jgi:hypothetical protein